MDIYRKIRKIREYRELSQEYMASKLSISQNSYSKVERGKSKITIDRFEKICKILHVDSQAVLVANERNLLQVINTHSDNNALVSVKNGREIQLSSLHDLYKLRIQHLREEIAFLENSLNKGDM